jgi:hypothetical protein
VNSTAGALVRFWWLVLLGVVAGAFAAAAIYSLEAQAKHTATAQVLVNSPSQLYLRTQQTTLTPQPSKVLPVRGHKGTVLKSVQQGATSTNGSPDTQTLVNAANLYPLLIESDRIKQLRIALIGRVPGTVKATALNATTNSFGVYRPSSLPVVEVTATSKHAADASAIATATVSAFGTWLVKEQRSAAIPTAQRITVQQLQAPKLTTTGGPSYGLPLFIGGLVFLGFCGLAVIADNAKPRRAREEAPRSEHVPTASAEPRLDP